MDPFLESFLQTFPTLLANTGQPPVLVPGGSATPDPAAGGALPYVGAVGDFISAALQTAGLYAQSDIIREWKVFLEHIGAFGYMVALMGAIFSVALFGNYKVARYLMVGPTLFYFMLQSTVPGRVTILRFGEREKIEAGQKSIFELFEPDGGLYEDAANVSWFYAKYDGVVSRVVQNVVAMLIDTKRKDDLITAATERALSRIFLYKGSDPAFMSFLSKSMMGRCADITSGYIELSNDRFRLESGGQRRNQAEFDTKLRDLKSRSAKAEHTLDKTDTDYLTSILGTNALNGINTATPVVTCDQLWTFVSQIVAKKAENIVTKETTPEQDVDSDIPWPEVKQNLERVIAQGNQQLVANVVAAYYLKNTLGDTTHAALTTQLFSRSPMQANRFNGVFGTLQDATTRAGYLQIVYFAGTIPYIQGLMLYLLSAAFPFFCLFLIIPGRMLSFCVWMGLWVWVKSWDIGFAAIYAIRALLVNFAGRGINNRQVDLSSFDPLSVFQIVYQNDPLATFNVHYVIIGILYLSVPLLTAHFCLGATNMFDSFKMAINVNGSRFVSRFSDQSRRRFAATPQEIALDQGQSRAGFAAAIQAMRDDRNRTASGNGNGPLSRALDRAFGERSRHGDASLAREMGRAHDEGIALNHLSPDQVERSAGLAAFASRRTMQSPGVRGQGRFTAAVDRETESMLGRPGETGHFWGDGSEKGTFKSPDYTKGLEVTNSSDDPE